MGCQYFAGMHVEVDPQLNGQAAHTIAHAVKDHICAELPAVRDVIMHIERGLPIRQSRQFFRWAVKAGK